MEWDCLANSDKTLSQIRFHKYLQIRLGEGAMY